MNDAARLARVLAALPADDATWLAQRLEAPSRRRARRLAARDELVRRLAMSCFGDVTTGEGKAAAIASALTRYVATPALRGRADEDPTVAALRDIIALNGERLLGQRQIRRILAGIRSSN